MPSVWSRREHSMVLILHTLLVVISERGELKRLIPPYQDLLDYILPSRSFGMQLRYASNTVMKAMQLFRLSTATLPSTALCSG
ncbi:hypothetical protein BHM03_00018824 [Ensete ventricosum]|nr:hypothetical protein BHM03_00018824 [Ensete ventricosum]